MKTCVLILVLVFAVPSVPAVMQCYQKYAKCVVPIINNWGAPTNCSLQTTLFKCLTNVAKECDVNVVEYFERYEKLIEDLCHPDAAKIEEWKKLRECVVNNANSFAGCTKDLPDDVCSASAGFIRCFSSQMNDRCGKFAGEVAKNLTSPIMILAEECEKGRKAVSNESVQCLMNKTEAFVSCKFKNTLNTVGDICSSILELRDCAVKKSGEICGAEAEGFVRLHTEDIAFVMDVCKQIDFIKGINLTECNKGFLKCNVDVYNLDDPKCSDMTKYLDCVAGVSKTCVKDRNVLLLLTLERYKQKFPAYCKEDFQKHLQEKSGCIDEKFKEALEPCYQQLQKDKGGIRADDQPGNLKVHLNFLGCVTENFGKKCDDQTKAVVSDLVNPLQQSMDDSCILLTGKKCNGACGLQVAIWVLFASVAFLLTRKNE